MSSEFIIPAIVTAGISGSYLLMGLVFRSQDNKISDQGDKISKLEKENTKKISDLEKAQVEKINNLEKENAENFVKLEHVCGEFMTKASHSLLCENSALKVKEHFTHEITSLKDELFTEFRKLEKTIKTNGKK